MYFSISDKPSPVMPYLRAQVTAQSSPAISEIQRDPSAGECQLTTSCHYSSREGPLYTLAGVSSAASFTQLQRACKAGSADNLIESDTANIVTDEQGSLTDLQPLILQLPPDYSVMLKLPDTDGPLLATIAKPSGLEQPVRTASSTSTSSSAAVIQQPDAGSSSPAAARVPESNRHALTPQACRSQLRHGRVLPSTDSLASITSVEAGQVLEGYEYILPCRVATDGSCSLDLCGADQPMSPATAMDSKVQQQSQDHATGSSPGQLQDKVSEPLPAADLKVAQTIVSEPQQHSSIANPTAGPFSAAQQYHSSIGTTTSSLSPAAKSPAERSQPGSVNVSPSVSANLRGGSGPLLELQTMSSMLGGEGEQLLLSDDSTGAIEPLSQSGLAEDVLPVASQAALPAVPSAALAHLQDSGPLPVVHEHGPPVDVNHTAGVAVSTALPAAGLALNSAFSGHSSGSSSGAFPLTRGTRFGFMRSQTAAAASSQYPASGRFNAYGAADAVSAAAAAAKLLAPSSAGLSVDSSQQTSPAGSSSLSAPLPTGSSLQQPQLSSAFSKAAYQAQLSPTDSSGQDAATAGQKFGSSLLQKGGLQSATAGTAAYEQWGSFRRPASIDCSRSLGSSRRRGSIELSMPWRSKLDAVIAQVAADDQAAPAGTAAVQSTDGGSSNTGVAAVGAATRSQSQGLPERSSAGDAAARLSSSGGGADATAAAPDTAADDLSEAGSLLGDYGGASDIIRGGSATLSELEAARSYGLEFDGAVLMQNADLLHLTGTGTQPWSEDMELLAAVHLQDQQVVQDPVQQQSVWSLDGDAHVLSSSVKHASYPGAGLTEQQQQLLASRGSPTVSSRLRLAVAEYKTQDQATAAEGSTSSLQIHAADGGISQQQQERQQQAGEDEQVVSPSSTSGRSTEQLCSPAAAAADQFPARQQLNSMNSISSGSVSSVSSRASASIYARQGAGSRSTSAAYELFIRLNRARQTLDFAKRQAEMFAELDHAELGIWEALDLLDSLREYEAALICGVWSSGSNSGNSKAAGQEGKDTQVAAAPPGHSSRSDLAPDMSLKEHALQVAELCRLSFPDKPWMALVGLIHGLGKLLAHPLWGSQPQWAVAGETYPLGCRFAPQISHSEFFSANPDRRRRAYSTALGVYTAGCGLRNVYMSWGASEYLYMMLVLNQTELPEEALFIIRYQRCLALTRPGGAYRQLMSDMDKSLMTLLADFQHLIAYKRVQLPPEALTGEQLKAHYDDLITKYLGEDKLYW